MAIFAEEFGIRPWEWDRLDLAEFRALALRAEEIYKSRSR